MSHSNSQPPRVGGGGGGGKLTSQPPPSSLPPMSPPHVNDFPPLTTRPKSHELPVQEFRKFCPCCWMWMSASQLPVVVQTVYAWSCWSVGFDACCAESWLSLYESSGFEPWFGSQCSGPYWFCVTTPAGTLFFPLQVSQLPSILR